MTQQSESQAMAHEATLFVIQMAGNSMINAGIPNGDLLIVDGSLAPFPEMWLRLSWTTKSPSSGWFHGPASPYCTPENPRYPDYMSSNSTSPAIWGIVADVIHPLISSSDRRTTASANPGTPTTLVPAC